VGFVCDGGVGGGGGGWGLWEGGLGDRIGINYASYGEEICCIMIYNYSTINICVNKTNIHCLNIVL
jgi:hypothetical protein